MLDNAMQLSFIIVVFYLLQLIALNENINQAKYVELSQRQYDPHSSIFWK